MKTIDEYIEKLSPRQLRVCLSITQDQRNKAKSDNAKLREQNRRLKAAIRRARKCQRYQARIEEVPADAGRYMRASDVLSALRLRK